DLLLNENLNIKTVKSNIFHLNAYATWLEENNIDWTYFPETRSERCLVVFRGDLIRKRDSLDLSPSTTTQRMRAVIKFYKWLKEKNLIDTNVLMWKDKVYKKKIINKFGFENTIDIMSTDLAIPLINNSNIELEGGLSLVNPREVPNILNVAINHSS